MTTFVALGDSTTAGFGDPCPVTGRWRGWAALLADGLGEGTAFHNLAASGARAQDVLRDQLPAALEILGRRSREDTPPRRPHLAAVLVGINDVLRGDFQVAEVGQALDHAVGTLRASGAVVLTACLPDPGRMFRLPAALARPLGRRIQALNAVGHRIGDRHHTVHLHIPEQPGVYDPRIWSIDRLHPGERGHRLLAGAYFDLLMAARFPVGRRPSPEPTSPTPSGWAQTRWLLTKGTRWLYARSTDLLPFLTRMAIAEWWYGLRGSAHRLDARIHRELTTALADLDDSVTLARKPR